MGLVLVAKKEVEEKYNQEKKKRLAVEAQVKDAQSAIPNAQDVPQEILDKLNQLRSSNA